MEIHKAKEQKSGSCESSGTRSVTAESLENQYTLVPVVVPSFLWSLLALKKTYMYTLKVKIFFYCKN